MDPGSRDRRTPSRTNKCAALSPTAAAVRRRDHDPYAYEDETVWPRAISTACVAKLYEKMYKQSNG
jgi:hypothetical protein